MLVSINYLSDLTGVKRQTVSKRVQDLPVEPGPNNSKMYDSESALRKIYQLDDENAYESGAKERARLDHHRANLEALKEAEKRARLLDYDATVKAVSEMIAACKAKLMALTPRVCQQLPVPPDVRRQAQDLMQKEVFSALDELSEHRLQGVGPVDEDVGSPADSDGERVGGKGKATQSRGKRRAGKVEE